MGRHVPKSLKIVEEQPKLSAEVINKEQSLRLRMGLMKDALVNDRKDQRWKHSFRH